MARDRRDRIHARASALAGSRAAVRAEKKTGEESAPTTAELWLYGVVGGYWFGFNDKTVADALRGLEVDQIIVRLNSPGGDAVSGVAIGNLLRNHKASIKVVVDGLAASAASVIALAGDEVVMSPGSQLMLHDPWMLTVGNAGQLASDAKWLDKQAQNYAELYAYSAGKGTAESWREVMLADDGRGTWYTAQEAVDAGLASSVGTVSTTTPPPAEPEPDDMDDDEMQARAAWDLEVLVHPDVRAAWRDIKPPSASASGSTHTEGGPAVAFSNAQITNLRAKLELPDDADEAAIVAAVEAVVEDSLEDRPAAEIPEGHVVVPEARLTDLEAAAAQGVSAAKVLKDQEREAFLDANKTKYAPTNRDAWAKEYDRDPAGTRKHFESAAEIIPVAELGHDNPVDEAKTEGDAVMVALFGDDEKAS